MRRNRGTENLGFADHDSEIAELCRDQCDVIIYRMSRGCFFV